MSPGLTFRPIRQRSVALVVLLATLLALLGGCAAGGGKREADGAGAPIDAAAVERLGEEAYAAGKWREAEPHYLALVSEIPQDAALWFRLGNIYARTDRPDAAVAAYREALVRDAANGKAWFNMGVVQLRQAANSFRRLGVHVEAENPMAVQGDEAYRAIMAILGIDEDDGGGKPAGIAERARTENQGSSAQAAAVLGQRDSAEPAPAVEPLTAVEEAPAVEQVTATEPDATPEPASADDEASGVINDAADIVRAAGVMTPQEPVQATRGTGIGTMERDVADDEDPDADTADPQANDPSP